MSGSVRTVNHEQSWTIYSGYFSSSMLDCINVKTIDHFNTADCICSLTIWNWSWSLKDENICNICDIHTVISDTNDYFKDIRINICLSRQMWNRKSHFDFNFVIFKLSVIYVIVHLASEMSCAKVRGLR